MATSDPIRYQAATAIFRLGLKASNSAIHRTINQVPKGKGWVQCKNTPQGVICKPDKVKESIEYFKIAYEVFPDIVALNQIALGYEIIGENENANEYFTRMRTQAASENNEAYIKAAEQGIARCAVIEDYSKRIF